MSDEQNKQGMSVLEKIMQAIRNDSRLLREAVMDASGTRLFEQQIEDAKTALKQAKHTLTAELAKELQCSRTIKILNHQIKEQEHKITDAMAVDDEAQAFELATHVVELEQDLQAQTAVLKSHELHLGHLKRQMEHAERQLKDLERQLAMVNTTERIQQATEVISQKFDAADSKLLSAKQELDRIRQAQQHVDEQYLVDEFGDANNQLENQSPPGPPESSKHGVEGILQRLRDQVKKLR